MSPEYMVPGQMHTFIISACAILSMSQCMYLTPHDTYTLCMTCSLSMSMILMMAACACHPVHAT